MNSSEEERSCMSRVLNIKDSDNLLRRAIRDIRDSIKEQNEAKLSQFKKQNQKRLEKLKQMEKNRSAILHRTQVFEKSYGEAEDSLMLENSRDRSQLMVKTYKGAESFLNYNSNKVQLKSRLTHKRNLNHHQSFRNNILYNQLVRNPSLTYHKFHEA